MRLSFLIKGLAVVLVVFVVALGVVLHNTDFNSYKKEISILVEALTDRKLVLAGNCKLAFGFRPTIAVDRVRFANAKWGSRRDMMRIKSLRAELELFPLLLGNIRIKRVVLLGADILVETRADGVGNWNLEPSAKTRSKQEDLPIIPTVDQVLIKDSVLVWRDGRSGTKHVIKINRLTTRAAAADAPLRLDLRGSYNGRPVRLDGDIDSLAALTSNQPTTAKLSLNTGGARLKLQGQIRRPMTGSGIKLALSFSGRNLATLSGLIETDLPALGPYDLSAVLIDRKSRWQLKGVKLRLGKSDFNGDVYIDPNTSPVRLFARLNSELVRIADLGDRSGASRSSPSRKKRRKAAKRIFPAEPVSFPGLGDVSATLAMTANRLQIDDITLENAAYTLALRKDHILLRPARAQFDGGDLTLYLRLAPLRRGMRFNIKADVKRLDLARLVERLGYRGLARGRINVNTALSGAGTSIGSMMGRLNGHLLATMRGGTINNRMFSRLSGDTLSAVLPWSSGDKGIQVKCLVGQYDVRRGRVTSNVTLLNTDRLLVEGKGGIDLASERIKFTIVPRAKEASVVNLLVPINIEGRLANPDISADAAGVAKNALGFATGGILANGIVSEIIGSIVAGLTGSDKENPCVEAISDAVSATPGKKKKDDSSVLDSLKSLFSR